MKNLLQKASALAVVCLFGNGAQAVDFSPRVGVSANSYYVSDDTDGAGIGGSAGLTLSSPGVFGDLNVETMPFKVRSPSNVGSQIANEDGWRTEIALTLGVPIYHSVSLIAGYRLVDYGTSAFDSDAATMRGPFVGVLLGNLRLADSEKDVFSVSFAIQPTTFEAESGTIGEESDVGASVRIGYRRAGSPHGFALRWQVFGGDITYDENLASLQYGYNF